MLKKVKKIFGIIWISILFTSKTFACSCMELESPEKALEKATWVFIGTVENIENRWFIDELIGSFPNKTIHFQVSQTIKWNYNFITKIDTAYDGASCWYEFEMGKEYIVYTYGKEENQEVSLCSRTSELIYAKDDWETFWNIISPKAPIWEFTTQWDNQKTINIPVIIILFVLSILFIYLRKS